MPVIIEPHRKAAEFAHEIRMTSRGMMRPRKKFAYRGQPSDFPLMPKAFRPGERFPSYRGWTTVAEHVDWLTQTRPRSSPPPDPAIARTQLEISTLAAFFEAADEAGLPLPEDSQLIRRTIRRVQLRWGKKTVAWPDPQLRSILALAQHHGLPTRLLDWTWDWRVAAFFAAKGAIDRRKGCSQPSDGTITVWALDAVESEFTLVTRGGSRLNYPRLELVTAPAATNANLRAQRGLFTLLNVGASQEDPARSLEALALEDAEVFSLTKFTLPATEAPALLGYLGLDGVTYATVFPGYGGVVEALRELAAWDPLGARMPRWV